MLRRLLTGSIIAGVAGLFIYHASASGAAAGPKANCSALPTAADLKGWLAAAPSSGGDAGGLFHGTRMWAAL